jgi:hypothetical protein
MASLVRFHKLFFEFREIEYIKAYEGAQKVYRSYLVDSQRIGVWAFLVAVLVLGLATFFNNRANLLLSPQSKSFQQAKDDFPIDTPKNALFIQTLAITILLVPLMKTIEPENIDPEKSYWMVSLQNWHTPTFIKALSDKDEERHIYTSSRPVINNEIKLDGLAKSIDELSATIKEGAADAKKKLNEINETIKKDGGQRIR